MSKQERKQSLLRRAVDLVGQQELARLLNIPESIVEAWIRGDATMPDGGLLNLATILDKWASNHQA